MLKTFHGTIVEAGIDGPVVKHTATTAPRRATLRRAAQLLSAVPHPGIVSLVGLDDGDFDTVMRTRFVDGATLDTDPPTQLRDLIGIGAATAQTVAELHEAGVTHGAIRSPHILVSDDQRPVLCGIGSGHLRSEHPERWHIATSHDVAALGEVLESLIETTQAPPGFLSALAYRRKAEALRSLCHRALDDPTFDASQLAESLASSHDDSHRSVRQLRTPMGLAALGLGVLLMGLGAGKLTTSSSATSKMRGCSTSVVPSAHLDGRRINAGGNQYEVGRPGDLVQLGDWDGDGIATPAIVRPSTGAVYVFDRWPSASNPARATPVAHLSGARAVACHEAADGGAEILVTLDSGRHVPLDVSSRQVHQP